MTSILYSKKNVLLMVWGVITFELNIDMKFIEMYMFISEMFSLNY